MTKLFNDEMKAQGLTGEVKVTVDSANGTFSLESTNESATGSIGWTGSSLADADGALSAGTILFSATAGTGGVTEAKKTLPTEIAAGKFNMNINGTTVQASYAGNAKDAELSTVATTVETSIQNAVDSYNTAMGYVAGDDKFLAKADFTVEADPSGGLKVVYNGKKEVDFSFSASEAGTTGKPDKTAGLLGLEGGSSHSGGAAGLDLQIGDTGEQFNRLTVSVEDMHAFALGVANVNIGNPTGAQKSIETIKDAINQVSSVRGLLGATQNRLEHTKNNLSVMTENIQDAESTIRDTDVADEMMAYTKNNILIQSAQAMLAQANAVPQGVLQLLQ